MAAMCSSVRTLAADARARSAPRSAWLYTAALQPADEPQRMADLRLLKEPEKIIAFYRKGLLFAFNFHPSESLTNVLIPRA